ncbi:MAG TPA: sigma-70 family RNA polymerase sigma factor, partial [Isosphaeraceae bacterium]
MSGASYGEALRQTRVLFEAGAVGGLTDRELLTRFVTRPGEPAEAAFAALVARHGPMVLRACSAAIGDEHEAHDAFQATFLVLARKAGSIRAADSVGPWLHEVARRVSACSRSAAARRGRHEQRAAEMSIRSVAGPEFDDLTPALHEELDRLPERYRAAILLCDLEGLTQEQAASQLGWPLGTVRSRLARGRDRLRGRLTRRGLAPSMLPLALPVLSDATIEATVRLAVAQEVPLTIRLLTDGGLRAMRLIRWKTAAVLTLAVGLAASGAGVLARRSLGQLPGLPARTGRPAVKPTAAPAPAQDFPGEDQVIVRVAPSGTKVWAFSPAT